MDCQGVLQSFKDRLHRDLAPYKSPRLVGHFLLPTVLLAGGALLDNPLIATTAATAGACLAMVDYRYRFNKINAPAVGSAILLATTVSSIHGLLNSAGTNRLIYLGNALVGAALFFNTPMDALDLYRNGNPDYLQIVRFSDKHSMANLAYCLSISLFPTICFEMCQWLSPSFAAVGVGIATCQALKISQNHNKLNCPPTIRLPLLPLAYGTAFAYFGISSLRIFDGSWTEGVAYAAAALIHASPFALYLRQVINETQQKARSQ